jgi:hypothetical protein
MRKIRTGWILALVLAITLTSCNFPLSQGGDTGSVDIGTIVALQVAQTQLAQTIEAGGQVTEPSPTPQVLAQEPTFTPTITLTSTPSLTPTPEGVWLTVVENTNCRAGPGTMYDFVTKINAGVSVQAIARNPENNYYYIQNPNGSGFCWLWDAYSTLTGNITILPMFTPQATPTPAATNTPTASVSVSFVQVTSCGGQYALRLKVKNTGGVTWQSVKVVIKDNTTATTFTHTLDQFRGYTGCPMDVSQEDLTPGEEGIISNVSPGQFGYDPTGHELKVTVTVYSENGLGGISASASFKVTP